ncbi:MAG: glycine--tRNA ligase subunit alpha [Planctomycetota bacterium]|nr:glycine--tRNA ligase subunit alpha [Planctomycetota bacterium]
MQKPPTFQDVILRLQNYWAEYGCAIVQPYDIEKGAGTFNPATFFMCLGPEPSRVAFVEPSRRPTDGRYGDNPNRLQRFHQYQVIVKPAPEDAQEIFLRSLEALGIDLSAHDVRFLEDDWESPTLGANGLGWEVWIDGMEITQFTYFQQMGSVELNPVSLEITYGLERIAMFLQDVDNLYDLVWTRKLTEDRELRYGDVFHEAERQFSHYNFSVASPELYKNMFDEHEKEFFRIADEGLIIPAYDHIVHAGHAFNMLDALGSVSVAGRADYVRRMRTMARRAAKQYIELREEMNHPLCRKYVSWHNRERTGNPGGNDA